MIGGRCFDLAMHCADGVVIAEFENLAPNAPTRSDMDRLSDEAIMGMMVPTTEDELLVAAPQAIRMATGFDRVMLYRFDEAFRGQVVGEARGSGIDSFMGMFFPESDIAGPVRELYTQNFARYIPDIAAPAARIEPANNPLTNQPLDLSRSNLRAVAPCHVEYMSNMGVTASMSFSIVSEGRLWGLFACHHYSTTHLSITQRLICEQIAMMFVAKLEEVVNDAAVAEEMERRRHALFESSPLFRGDPLSQAWTHDQQQELLDVVNAEGVLLYSGGKAWEVGTCPDTTDLRAFIEGPQTKFDALLHRDDAQGLFHTRSTSTTLPLGTKMQERGSGALIVPLSRERREFLVWFRPELVVHATWAGNPSDSSIKDPDALLSPRRSFAAWKEDIRDLSAPWTLSEIANAMAIRDHVMALIN
jgi:light-regulated signal transduction histidine kinase (bacteriophytochrome)